MSMSKGDRQSVLRTTKVRTALKGDNSWIQRRAEAQAEQEEKPWLAEVRGTRTNGDSDESSSVSPPTSPSAAPAATPPSPTSTSQPSPSSSLDFSNSPKPPSGGYLIRGVFTKTDTKKPTSPLPYNGSSPSSTFIPKKPSDSYKKIAPHSVRTASESSAPAETTLSSEEQDKRAEAASSVLRTSAAKQRSYVLSAAKKYESPEKADSQLSPNSVSFVAKRVEINDEEESAPTDAQNDVTPRVPTPQDTVPQPTKQSSPAASTKVTISDTKISSATSSSVETKKLSPAPSPSAPVSTKVVKPASAPDTKASPAKISQVVKAEPAPVPSKDSGKDVLTLTKSPQVEAEPAPSPTDDLENDDLITVTESPQVEAEPAPSPADDLENDDLITVTESPQVEAEPAPSPTDDLENDDLITVTESSQVKADPAPAPSDNLENDDLIALAESTEVLVDPVPSTTDIEYSHDLLSGPDSSQSEKTVVSLDKLAVDFIPIDTNRKYLSTDRPLEDTRQSPTKKQPADTQSPLVLVDPLPSSADNPSQNVVTSTVSVKEQKTKFEDLSSTQTTIRTVQSSSETVKTTSTKSTIKLPSETIKTTSTKSTIELPSETVKTTTTKSAIELPSETVKTTSTKSTIELPSETVKTTTTKSTIEFPSETVKTTTTKSTIELPSETVKTTTTKSAIELPSETVKTTSTKSTIEFPSETVKTTTTKSTIELPSETVKTTTTKSTIEFPSETVKTTTTKSSQEPLIPLSSRETLQSWETSRKYVSNYALDSQSADNDSDSKTETLITTEEEQEEPEAVGADDAEDDWKYREESSTRWSSWRTQTIASETEATEESEPEPQRPPSVPLDRALENTIQELDSLEPKKSFVYVKEYVNSELANNTSQNGGNEYVSSRTSSYSYSSPPTNFRNCTYCGELVGSDAKITIEDLNIYCHPSCFKCGVCSRPMGDLLYNMFLHHSTVHCETCYSNLF
ncbi:zinc finger protein 185 isoform X38 [Anguilla rostrata]|uniref:zinc finger protein 185 isoform X38 n=1 Tax=Anguilla rostrata TaxID=7938 RepID=UPI0030CC0848